VPKAVPVQFACQKPATGEGAAPVISCMVK
jgi:hypothetical protein